MQLYSALSWLQEERQHQTEDAFNKSATLLTWEFSLKVKIKWNKNTHLPHFVWTHAETEWQYCWQRCFFLLFFCLAQIQAGGWPQAFGFEASNTRDGTRVQALWNNMLWQFKGWCAISTHFLFWIFYTCDLSLHQHTMGISNSYTTHVRTNDESLPFQSISPNHDFSVHHRPQYTNVAISFQTIQNL